MKINAIYEITAQWFADENNQQMSKLMPEWKVGAQFEVLEVDDWAHEGASMVRFIESGKAIHVEQSPVGAYQWVFVTDAEVDKGYIKLVSETRC